MCARFLLILALCSAVVVPLLQAESPDCSAPVIVVPDGRITQSTFLQGATYWFGIYAQAGRSYSVEFVPSTDNYLSTAKVQIATLSVFGPSDNLYACHGTSSVAVTQNSGYAPVILKGSNGAGRRVSFIAASTGLHVIAAPNAGGTGTYTFRAVETSMFNLRWSTCGGYTDQWGFLNTTDMPVTGTFTLFDGNNNAIASAQVTIPPQAEVIRTSNPGDLNVPAKQQGFAVFSHNGPPDAVVADAYMISPTGLLVNYTKFEGIGGR
jgi:hypothetical protein